MGLFFYPIPFLSFSFPLLNGNSSWFVNLCYPAAFIQRPCFPALAVNVLFFKTLYFFTLLPYIWWGQTSAERSKKGQVLSLLIDVSSETFHWLISVIFWNFKMSYNIDLWIKSNNSAPVLESTSQTWKLHWVLWCVSYHVFPLWKTNGSFKLFVLLLSWIWINL